MEIENMLAKNINTASHKANYDASCKRLLANKIILAWIMKSCLEEYRDYDVEQIAQEYIEDNPTISKIPVNQDETLSRSEQISGSSTEDSTITEGIINYDIRFFASVPRTKETIKLILNVEAQNDFYPGYPIIKRSIYYCSRLISAQYGTEFTDSHYEKIRKVYSIWFCINPPAYRKNTITRYIIQEENLIGMVSEKKENYDLMTVIMICLGNSQDDRYTGILKLLEVLLSSQKEPEEKKIILQNDFKIKMTKELESEVSLMCNLSKGVEERGILIGLEQGRIESILSAIQNLMDSMDWSAEQAMRALKIPESEQSVYSRKLNK